MDEIEKLDEEHTAACLAFLDASDTLDDARKARDAASEMMLVAAKAALASHQAISNGLVKEGIGAEGALNDARKARDAYRESMFVSAKALNKAVKEKFLNE